MKRNYAFFMLAIFIYGCSVQHVINPDRYDYLTAKNQLTTNYALISTIEHTTIHRLQLNQISVQRAKGIDNAIKGINFKLNLAKQLIEAGNYKESYSISKKENNKLQILLKSLKGEFK